MPSVYFMYGDSELADSLYGVIHSSGSHWHDHRLYFMRNLSDMRKDHYELFTDIIENEIGIFCDILENDLKDGAKVVTGNGMYVTTTTNIIWQVATCERLNNADIKHVVKLLAKIGEGGKSKSLVVSLLQRHSFLGIKFLDFFNVEPMRSLRLLMEFVQDRAIKRATGDEHGYIVNRYLAFFENKEKSQYDFKGNVSHTILAGALDLLFAGAETSSLFMEWAVFYLIKYPEVQERAFQEIKKVIGLDRSPRLSDRPNTPYCLAVMEEIIRLCPETDIALPHYTTKDTDAMGYRIPKGTQVFAFYGGVHKSERYFDNHMEFKPERHIYNGIFKNHKYVNFFGIGKRRCAGENIGRDEIYLFFLNVVQKFQYQMAPNEELIFRPKLGALFSPQPYEMIVSCRKSSM